MYSTTFNNNNYQLDLPNSFDESYAGGIWDLAYALSNRIVQMNEQVKSNELDEYDLTGTVYDFLQQFKIDSMALGGHTYGDITTMKADMWLTMYDECKQMLSLFKNTGDTPYKKAQDIALMLRHTGYEVHCDYSDNYPYYDYEVWTKDKQYGIRIFFSSDTLKLQKEFYGYICGDDTIYEDLNEEKLEHLLCYGTM